MPRQRTNKNNRIYRGIRLRYRGLNQRRSSLVSINAIIRQGHSVTFTHKPVTISDINGRYTRTYSRVRGASDWVLHMNILKELTELRKLHYPLHQQRLYHAPQVTLTQRNLGRPYPPTQLRLSHVLSARLYSVPRSMRQRVVRLHYRCGHKPADVMTAMVAGKNQLWRSTKVTAAEIHVFSHTNHVYSAYCPRSVRRVLTKDENPFVRLDQEAP